MEHIQKISPSYVLQVIRKLVHKIATLWLIIGSTLLLILFLEMTCSLIDKVTSDHQDPNYFRKVDSYKDAAWIDDYYKEFISAFNTSWKSYVYWSRKPFQGKHINVDERGIRYTFPGNVTAAQPSTKLKIFMFGGSTMWGEGVRDRYTIPSQLGNSLSRSGVNAEITNFGETGYVSTQEMIELMLQLQRGNIPDMAIFYDGINDVYAAYQSGIVGIPMNEWKRDLDYNISSSRYNKLRKVFFLNTLDRFCLGRTIKSLAAKIHPNIVSPPSIDGLDSAILNIYLNNIKMIDALGKAYGFIPIFYWQPVIYNKSNLSAYEENFTHDQMKVLYGKTYALVKNNYSKFAAYHFNDISDIFAQTKEPLYIDYCHVNENGNKVIADRMAIDLEKIIESKNDSRLRNGARANHYH